MQNNENLFIDDGVDHEDSNYSLSNFNLVTTPNDFNAATIVAFMDKGVFKIPAFQRNFVWDIQKASKLIESLIIGLPIPQIFLYEKGRNNFEIIDGQQRLLSLYFFVKGRFPRNEYRYELRNPDNMGEKTLFKEEFINDDRFFTNFNLKLLGKGAPEGAFNILESNNYNTLDVEHRVELDLSTIRNMVIKSAENDDNEHLARYEIFNRLNSGGINLNGQEIRMSLYSCEFLDLLTKLNKNPTWRKFFGKVNPDNRLKDIEIILRLFAMLINGGKEVHQDFPDTSKILYQNSILSFLNNFANYSKNFDNNQLENFSKIWTSFMDALDKLDVHIFSNAKDETNKTTKVSIPVFESIFFGIYRNELKKENIKEVFLTEEIINELKNDDEFLAACNGKTSSKNQVNNRLQKSLEYFSSKGI